VHHARFSPESEGRKPNPALLISQAVRTQLGSIVRFRSLSHALVRCAQIALLAAAGNANRDIFDKLQQRL
jgi:hypothetical protein